MPYPESDRALNAVWQTGSAPDAVEEYPHQKPAGDSGRPEQFFPLKGQ
jgi:hypothetical protein